MSRLYVYVLILEYYAECTKGPCRGLSTCPDPFKEYRTGALAKLHNRERLALAESELLEEQQQLATQEQEREVIHCLQLSVVS